MEVLPAVRKEVLKLPRHYIASCINTVIGEPFQKWTQTKVDERNAKVKDDKEMAIELDPEIAEIFKNSTNVSGKYFPKM